jgi:hypothetical protein
VFVLPLASPGPTHFWMHAKLQTSVAFCHKM